MSDEDFEATNWTKVTGIDFVRAQANLTPVQKIAGKRRQSVGN
jgi:hypothetical protein